MCCERVVTRLLCAADFFRGYDVIESSVQLGTGPDGRSNGEGLVGFASSGEVGAPSATRQLGWSEPAAVERVWHISDSQDQNLALGFQVLARTLQEAYA